MGSYKTPVRLDDVRQGSRSSREILVEVAAYQQDASAREPARSSTIMSYGYTVLDTPDNASNNPAANQWAATVAQSPLNNRRQVLKIIIVLCNLLSRVSTINYIPGRTKIFPL